jgi:hypothetical protein
MEAELYGQHQPPRLDGTYEPEVPRLRDALGLVGLIDAPQPPLPPCIYTAIHDPIEHFLEGYSLSERSMLGAFLDDPVGHPHAPYHFAVPYSPLTGSASQDFFAGARNQGRFEAFVRDVAKEEPALATNHEYHSFFSQSRVLSALADQKVALTGYIPSTDNLASAWPKFLAERCPGAPRPEELPHLRDPGPASSSSSREDPLKTLEAARAVWSRGGPVAKALCFLHALDYACWTDLPGGIPRVCSEVYEQHASDLSSAHRSERNRDSGDDRLRQEAIAELGELESRFEDQLDRESAAKIRELELKLQLQKEYDSKR